MPSPPYGIQKKIFLFQLDEPALGMPSREYYLYDSDSVDIKAYLKYMCDVAVHMGANPDTIVSEMKKVLQFETHIANVSILQVLMLYNYLNVKISKIQFHINFFSCCLIQIAISYLLN